MKAIHVYRLDITYPEGSREPGWEPAGWNDTGLNGYLDEPPEEFRWPRERLFLSRSGASQQARLLRGYGAKVEIVPSLPVEWPAEADGA